MSGDETVEYPIDGVLDLHSFLPKDTKSIINEYIRECLVQNILEIRIIHGKGSGALRETVHSILKRHSNVLSFRLAQGTGSGWGATLVVLKK